MYSDSTFLKSVFGILLNILLLLQLSACGGAQPGGSHGFEQGGGPGMDAWDISEDNSFQSVDSQTEWNEKIKPYDWNLESASCSSQSNGPYQEVTIPNLVNRQVTAQVALMRNILSDSGITEAFGYFSHITGIREALDKERQAQQKILTEKAKQEWGDTAEKGADIANFLLNQGVNFGVSQMNLQIPKLRFDPQAFVLMQGSSSFLFTEDKLVIQVNKQMNKTIEEPYSLTFPPHKPQSQLKIRKGISPTTPGQGTFIVGFCESSRDSLCLIKPSSLEFQKNHTGCKGSFLKFRFWTSRRGAQ